MQFIIKKERREQLIAEFTKRCGEWFSKENLARQFGSEREYCDSNWCTNTYLIYLNDYITFDRFFDGEFEYLINTYILNTVNNNVQYNEEYAFLKDYISKLHESIYSLSRVAFKASYDQIGNLVLTAISRDGN